MKRAAILRLCVGVCVAAIFAGQARAAAPDRPNFLIILADDLGFSDLGCYGGEIATPNLDSLAAGGLRYTQFYNTARCWPTRAALLTGYYPQQVGFDRLPGVSGRGHGPRPPWARLLPELLRPLGYRSYHSGKWHIDGGQIEGGFDRSYAVTDYDRFFSPQHHTLDDEPLPPVDRDSGYYSTTAMADYAIEFLEEHAESTPDQPFFCYLAFFAPHFPLHALPEDIARYRDRYQVGWDAIRAERWQRMRDVHLIDAELSPLEPQIGPPSHHPDALETLGPGEVNRELAWSELTPEQQQFQAAKMAIHAAMVDRMDREIGRVLEQLRAMNAFDNTVIIFLSDNGSSAEIMVRGDGHDRSAPLGSADSFLCLGPGFSRAGNTPFRRHKSWVHEGGIATPLVLHWPAGIATAGQVRHHAVGHVIDLAPTLLELAGGSWPTEHDGQPLPETPGRSLAPTFDQDLPLDREVVWWLHQGNRALRIGDWKIVAARGDPWELYHLSQDRTELHNLAEEQHDRLRHMERVWSDMTEDFIRLHHDGAKKSEAADH